MANLLTALRLALIPPVCAGLLWDSLYPPGTLLLLVSAAALSDYWDGIVARQRGTASARGQLFDHGSDCLFVSSGLLAAAIAGWLPLALPMLVVAAFAQYLLDSRVLERRKSLRMSTLGRWNGILYFVPLFLLAGAQLPFDAVAAAALRDATTGLGWLLVASTVVSMGDRATASWRR